MRRRTNRAISSIVNNVERAINEYGRYLAGNKQYFTLPGLRHALEALGKLRWWSE